ncbi:MAG: DUF882 domain-containing protein [Shinella sp.]|nr:DUF882 domain-containing protein [Shinella sp.]
MGSLCKAVFSKAQRLVTTAVLSAALILPATVPSATEAEVGTRSLKLFYIHTKEKAEITFKRNGRYDQRGLQQLNRFLRDWRRNEPTKMDPRLFDLVWEVYQKSGSRDYIHVVSAYRSPATNSMLRSRSRGVAKKSQHMLGRAMDFYIPDVKLSKLRAIGMKFQVGGVGYYPKSGAPFVHMDVGSVRAWPRMSRQELVGLFPDGKTMHLPSDGKPLPGYEQAVADYKRRVGADTVMVAGGGSSPSNAKRRTNLFAALFGQGGDEDEEPTAIASAEPLEENTGRSSLPGVTAAAPQPGEKAPAQETELAFTAPVPANRPAFREQNQNPAATELALVSQRETAGVEALDAALPKPDQQTGEFANLDGYRIPVPELLARNERKDAVGELLTASAGNTDAADDLGQMVPIPGARPAFRDALVAAAEAEVAVPEAPDRKGLAALAGMEQPTPVAGEASTRVALAAPTGGEQSRRPVEMVALVPERSGNDRPLAGIDAFDGEAAEVPLKGGRPKKKDADAAARGAIRTEPKLTQKIISQWALAQDRMAMLSKPVKAPRFVSRDLRASPTAVYAAGFKSDAGSVDPGRFSGTAVNFMEVRKFAQVN